MSITDDATLLLTPSVVIHHSLSSRVLLLAPSGVPHHSLKSFVLSYSLRQLCFTTRTRSSILDPLLDPKYEPIKVSSIPAATNFSAGALSGPRGVSSPVIPGETQCETRISTARFYCPWQNATRSTNTNSWSILLSLPRYAIPPPNPSQLHLQQPKGLRAPLFLLCDDCHDPSGRSMS